MGKKRIIKPTEEELIKDQEKVDAGVRKETKTKKMPRSRDGKVFISSTYNNTIMTLTDKQGQVLAWKSAGAIGFKGTKKSTSFAASKVSETIARITAKFLTGYKCKVYNNGIGDNSIIIQKKRNLFSTESDARCTQRTF